MPTPNELIQDLVAAMTGVITAIGAFLASVVVLSALINREFAFSAVGNVAEVQLLITLLIGGVVASLLRTGKGGHLKAAAVLGPGLYLALPILLTAVVFGVVRASLSLAVPMILGSLAGFYLGAGLKRRIDARGGNATQPASTA